MKKEMPGFVDLHCHWIPGVDDGVDNLQAAVELLRGLRGLGFARVVATPHMRPGLFDNTRAGLLAAFERTCSALGAEQGLPELSLSSEHYFDDEVFGRLLSGEGLPYPGQRAVLLEFYQSQFPRSLDQLLGQLRVRGLLPVVAHPERYQPVWKNPEVLERLLDVGAIALLDIAALAGKYGRRPKRCAEELLERGCYQAACSDAHSPKDLGAVEKGMEIVQRRYGEEELEGLLHQGPLDILAGTARG